MNVPFLQTATFTGLVSTDGYRTSKEWSDAYTLGTTYQTSSGSFVTSSTLSELSTLLLPITLYQEASSDWQNTYTYVQSNSSTWNAAYSSVTTIQPLTSNWNTAYNIATFYSQNSAILVEQTTFSTLTSLKANNQLKPGQLYQINDFQLMWWNLGQNFIQVLSSTTVEPLIVQAITNNKIAAEALSVLHSDDIVYYDIDARTSTTWSAGPSNIPNFKGWIYRRIDLKKNIDIAWDWRYITHNCCRYDIYSVPLYVPDTTYNRGSLVRSPTLPNRLFISLINNNTSSNATPNSNWRAVTNFNNDSLTYYPTIEAGVGINLGSNYFENVLSLSPILSSRAQFYTFTDSITTPTSASDLSTKSNVNNIKINGPGSYHIIFDCRNSNNNLNTFTIDLNSRNNLFSISVVAGASNTRFGGNFIGNSIFGAFTNNFIGDNFQYNTTINNSLIQFNNIGGQFIRNHFGATGLGQQFQRNFVKDNCSGNYFQNTQNNTIGDTFQNNSFLGTFTNNVVGNTVTGNVFSTTTQFNRFGDSFIANTLGSSFQSNIFSNNCNNNTIGTSFAFNTVGSNFNYNNIGNNCTYNSFGEICTYNTLSNFFQFNNIKTDFSYNNINTSFYENTIQNAFTNNTIGDNFHSNTVNSNFQSNVIGSYFNNATIGSEIQGLNFTGATHVYNGYDKNIFKNVNLVPRLSYYNSSDQLVVTDPTA